MGGFGSGFQGRAKTTVEACLRLSSHSLMRAKYLGRNLYCSGTTTWSNSHTGEKTSSVGWTITTGPSSGSMRLRHTRVRDGASMDYSVGLTTTPLPWGGWRWWFTCPLVIDGRDCGRRVGTLYLPPGGRYFGCRHCYDLTYTSCQESHKFDSALASIGAPVGLSARDVMRLLKEKG